MDNNIEDCIAVKQIDSYTYHIGYIENNVFDPVASEKYYGDAVDKASLMQVVNPHLKIKEIK
ncbi:hypothetical protein ACLCDV_08165 [Sphingobacterium sp. Lzh-3]|uniref:hypothetical protein n=1 Tax=Sphingobacterium sp. Lzh-3 TaxID=3382150 RepID=UPI00398CA1C2